MKNSIAYFTIAISAAGALFLMTRTATLQQKLERYEEQQALLDDKLKGYEQLLYMDSLLLKGDYDSAIRSYSAARDVQVENKMGIPLRISLAEKLLNDKKDAELHRNTFKASVDTTAVPVARNAQQIRKYDSLNFTLEKAKVQLARLQRQLRDKSFGEYLKFKSKKGNQLHYVGQVKNGKANGFGIALLDSGSRYEGQWKDNQREGEGMFYWPDGEYYVGTYQNDKRSGFGTYFWPNGEKYAGEWKEDKRNGSGEFFGTDGDVVAGGEWDDDKLVEVNKK